MEKLKKLGFKKIKTEPGIHMYELTPARAAGPAASDSKIAKRPSAQARKFSSAQANKRTSLTNN